MKIINNIFDKIIDTIKVKKAMKLAAKHYGIKKKLFESYSAFKMRTLITVNNDYGFFRTFRSYYNNLGK